MQVQPSARSRLSLKALGPGILVAATGVGAGDLATATFTGTQLGTAILWAVLVGAALKYVLNEGLTRWQLATGTTLLEGSMTRLGRVVPVLWLGYLLVWSYLVAMALMSACGVATQAILPFFQDPSVGKIVYGICLSLVAWGLIRVGGYQLFERVMSVCIGVMFMVVVLTAILLRPDWSALIRGLCWPSIPNWNQGGLSWTIALLGGVGGTVTVLCYGYWIREENRHTLDDLPACRLDLAVGYAMTAIFGVAMVVIGSQLGQLDSKGATLIIEVAATLSERTGSLGPAVKWAFLLGAWGAVFSSLLGVWQSVPYLFVDYWRITLASPSVDTRGSLYRWHLAAIACLPISGLFLFPFKLAMQVNGMIGAIFIPMLASVLMILNGQDKYVGPANRNSPVTQALLLATLLFFILAAGFQFFGND